MALDASIYSRFAVQPKSVADYDREYADAEGAKQTQQLNALRLLAGQRQEQDAQRVLGEQGAIRNALSQLGAGATDDQRVNALRALGTQSGFSTADSLEKSLTERQKTRADIGVKEAQADKERLAAGLQRFEIIGQIMGGVRDQASYDLARQQAAAQFGPEFAAKIPPQYDPNQIAQAQQQAMSVKERLEQEWKAKGYDLQAKGQQQQMTIAQMNDARVRAEGAANRGVTMRGQNMTDARVKESTSAAMTKPFEVTGPDGLPMLVQQDKQGNIKPVEGYGPKSGSSKPLNDAQAKALLFGTRMQEAGKIMDSLEGKYSPAAVNAKMSAEKLPLVGGLAGMAGNAMLSDEGQQVEQAQRDFVNAVLRRESGAVISDSEFANAQKQYFPQPNDSAKTLAQKKRNRDLATSGLLAEVPEGRRASITPTPTETKGPKPGAVEGGYRFKGGNPADKANWEKV